MSTTTHDEFWVIGRSIRASNDDPSGIGALWGGIFGDPFADQVDGPEEGEIYAVYCDYAGDHTQPYSYVLGYRVNTDVDTPEGLHKQHVPAGSFETYRAEGEQPAALIQSWQRIWADEIDRAFAVDFEVHRDGGRVVDIFVGVR